MGMDEFQAKADCENFYCRLRLKAHFQNQADNKPRSTPDPCHPFAKFNPAGGINLNPPEGSFLAIDYYINRCRRAVNALDFMASTKYNNLPTAEKQALLSLTKRNDIVFKPDCCGMASPVVHCTGRPPTLKRKVLPAPRT